MIQSFCCHDTEKLFNDEYVGRFGSIEQIARRKLEIIDVSEKLDDLRQPPGNHLEALKGKRKGQCSIRINNKWRICFRWKTGNAWDVEIVDYH